MPRDRSIAVISNATRPNQRTITGTLQTIETQVGRAHLVTPALIVGGEVVRLHEMLNWFEIACQNQRRSAAPRASM